MTDKPRMCFVRVASVTLLIGLLATSATPALAGSFTSGATTPDTFAASAVLAQFEQYGAGGEAEFEHRLNMSRLRFSGGLSKGWSLWDLFVVALLLTGVGLWVHGAVVGKTEGNTETETNDGNAGSNSSEGSTN